MSRRATLWLGLANAAEFATQLALPALLVRALSPDEFGGYRLLWLVAQTSATVLSLNMALNLLYVAPRHRHEDRGRLAGNVFAYLAVAGALAALLAGSLGHHLQGAARGHAVAPWLLGLFAALWMVSLPFDTIALVAGRPKTQALFFAGQSLVRMALLGATAWWARELAALALAMVALAALRVAVAAVYVRRSGFFPGVSVDLALARAQLQHGLGFGVGSSLFVLRSQADIWITAALFNPVGVATFAIAVTVGPVIGALKQSFTQASVSRVAQLVTQGDMHGALSLNSRANLGAALLLFPFVGAFVLAAPDAIAWVYTAAFTEAALPARLYAVALTACVLELTPVVQSLGHGRFVLRSNAALLLLSVCTSWVGGSLGGIAGVTAGSALALWTGTALNLVHVARSTGLPVAALQPWRELAALASLAALATALSAAVPLPVALQGSAATRAIAHGLVFSAVYALLALLTPPARRLYRAHLFPR